MFLYFKDSDVEVDRFEDEGESSEEENGEALEDAIETLEADEPTIAIDTDTLEASGNVIVYSLETIVGYFGVDSVFYDQ